MIFVGRMAKLGGKLEPTICAWRLESVGNCDAIVRIRYSSRGSAAKL